MKFTPITLERLYQMQDILNNSAGYKVSLDDEIEYFNETKSNGWWLATTDDGHPSGFIRHFKQNSDWTLGELYVSPTIPNRLAVAEELLGQFQTSISFPKGHRLRFDVCSDDHDLNRALHHKGFSERVQIFKFFQCDKYPDTYTQEIHLALLTDVEAVAETISNLHPVTNEEVGAWIKNCNIFVIRNEFSIVAAAQVYESDSTLEINRFATHKNFLYQGFASQLMKGIFQLANARSKKRIILKVEDCRLAAISFYEKMGFLENPKKCQAWHSRWY